MRGQRFLYPPPQQIIHCCLEIEECPELREHRLINAAPQTKAQTHFLLCDLATTTSTKGRQTQRHMERWRKRYARISNETPGTAASRLVVPRVAHHNIPWDLSLCRITRDRNALRRKESPLDSPIATSAMFRQRKDQGAYVF